MVYVRSLMQAAWSLLPVKLTRKLHIQVPTFLVDNRVGQPFRYNTCLDVNNYTKLRYALPGPS